MLAIFKKEIHAYFTSIMGWVFLAALLLTVGLYHWINNLVYAYGSFAYALASCIIIFVLIIPIFTMRIISEETHLKTDQLLYTAPVTIAKIVIGKYLAMITVFFIGVAVIATYPLGLKLYGTVNLKEDYLALFMFFMMGCTYMALGMFISSLFESQILSAIVTMVAFLFTVFSSGVASLLPTDNLSVMLILSAIWLLAGVVVLLLTKNVYVGLGLFAAGEIALVVLYFVYPVFYDGALLKFFDSFSIANRVSNGLNGIFCLADLVYFISVIFMFLFFTVQSINKKRWA